MAALGYSFADIETTLGLPSGYAQIESVPVFHRLRLLREKFYELDIDDLERLARREFTKNGVRLTLPKDAEQGMLDNAIAILDDKQNPPRNTWEAFIREALLDIDRDESR